MAGLLGTIASDVGVAAVVPQALHGIIKITKLCRRRRATSHDETAVECPSQHWQQQNIRRAKDGYRAQRTIVQVENNTLQIDS